MRACAAALRSGQLVHPLSRMALARVAPCSEALGATLLRLDSEGLAPAHMALLLEVAADAAEARMNGASPPTWCGPAPKAPASHSRDTLSSWKSCSRTLSGRFSSAPSSCSQGNVVFKPLAARMEEVPDLRVRLFLHVARGLNDTRHESELLREFAARFESSGRGRSGPRSTTTRDGLDR